MNYLDIIIPFVGAWECLSMACRLWPRLENAAGVK